MTELQGHTYLMHAFIASIWDTMRCEGTQMAHGGCRRGEPSVAGATHRAHACVHVFLCSAGSKVLAWRLMWEGAIWFGSSG